ncbi:hypothetical protein RN001_011719 [Aquatica leii]|uniref:Uncharacterized protein n=1 Tax=Aquatica leii TaxID=1421715 RepID=A0AAN7SCY7_9COLE|nr:hypothetical protein RN001_011719 [Aquatica leii]
MDPSTKDLLGLTGCLEKGIQDFKNQGHSLQELRNALIQQTNFYKAENAKMEANLKKLQLLPSDLNNETKSALDTFSLLQEKYETKLCNCESIGLSHADRLRKQTNYVTKLKSCIKLYLNFNEKLLKEIRIAKGELNRSEKEIDAINITSNKEVKTLQVKIERYEKEILKFEKKYPWLSDPQYNLPNISKETETLSNLQLLREKLVQELKVYRGLKPDITKATRQLAVIEKEYDSMI